MDQFYEDVDASYLDESLLLSADIIKQIDIFLWLGCYPYAKDFEKGLVW